ncbi:MAG: DUF1631 domain-containing protein [Betaproteobacteria bacterium]
MSATTTSGDRTARRPVPRDMARILGDCRDLAIHRLLLSFTSMLDRVGDLLMARAERSDVREDQSVFLDAREVLTEERANLMADFERHLRHLVDERISGKGHLKADFSAVDAKKLTLIDTDAMDESVLSGNIIRVVENACQEELRELNRGVGYLMGEPNLETAANPLAPTTIVAAFTEALHQLKADQRIKLAILKELNQTSFGDIAAIYADVNRHLEGMNVVPQSRPGAMHRSSGGHAGRGGDGKGPGEPAAPPPQGSGEIDLMAMLQRFVSARMGQQAGAPMPAGLPPGGIQVPAAGPSRAGQEGQPLSMGALASALGMMANSAAGAAQQGQPAVGPFGGPRILVTPELGDALARLQHGETNMNYGGVSFQLAGLQQDMHNVLHDLQESPLGAKANQLEAMTIELVAMLFDFIFETKDLPDGIKALIGRMQMPVLRAAMLDGAFFSKKSHPSRLLVNALSRAGIGWAPTMGHGDPLYRKIEAIVHRVLEEFSDDIGLFDELRADLEKFLDDEDKSAAAHIQSTAEEIDQRDRLEIAQSVASAEVELRLRQHPTPTFLALFLRHQWMEALTQRYLREGENSEGWTSGLSTLDDLIWSVQPKRETEERKRLVAMLRNLLKRLQGGLVNIAWEPGGREQFMTNLVEAHAAAVKPSLALAPMPTTAVAEAAAAAAVEATAKGDVETAAKARKLAEAMAPTPAPPPPEPPPEVPQDRFAEIAATLERGMWVEFEGEDGQLAFAKLAWVSPLRGTYLFTNRQGQKAVSLSADELAERFRNDRARLVEAEPLVDRAFTSMMATLEEKFADDSAVAAQPA